jgi:hypothetical protein
MPENATHVDAPEHRPLGELEYIERRKNKGGRSRPLALKKRPGRSALRKLEARAGFLVAVFLAFDDA